MKNKRKKNPRGEIVIYKPKKGSAQLRVNLQNETVWLRQKQIASLFGVQRPAITKHLANIFESGELKEDSVCSILEHTASDGKRYKTKYYNLDAIISVGYRVNSRRATDFRIWATNVLREYVKKGYVLNRKRLEERREIKINELENAIGLLKRVAGKNELNEVEAKGLLCVITEYADSWLLLDRYDKGKLAKKSSKRKKGKLFEYDKAKESIEKLKKNLMKKKEASDIFGKEHNKKLEGILGNVAQSFGGKQLYPSVEEKAAHLLYFVIKDHPFVDGNKRIGSLLFLLFLKNNNYLLDKKGEKKINDNAMVALALLIAQSDPKEKDVMIALVTNLL